ncbi:zinc finger MYM-type protein 1-like [Leptopilina boulardi]|uniref:zinc finger MYM-type protein 1-like n=1 Tax=Leptopilina boulardi TaxID=63433 RepID=UPI0021F5E315|nr:zinc finger MYM-type protein 1-like [Leptopilina boulardi]
MSENKKHSGSYYRKRKLQETAELQKQATAFKRFIQVGSSQSSDSFNVANQESLESSEGTESLQSSIPISDAQERIQSEDLDEIEKMRSKQISVTDIPQENETIMVSQDPGQWPVIISDQIRQILIKRGPEQVSNIQFPKNNDGRKFSVQNYRRRMPNGEDVHRSWLIYSVSRNKIFCFCCRLFGASRISLSTESGYCDWKHMSELLSEHEISPGHMKAFQSWVEFAQRLSKDKTIDSENQRIIKNEVKRWTEVLKRIIWAIKFLGSQNLALRGKTDQLYLRDNGNFLKLFEFIGKFDPIIAEHLRSIESKESHVHYLNKRIQNEVIELLSLKIKEHILNGIKKWTYYSILLDCTPDTSLVEQMSLIIRYVRCEPGEEPSIEEHFLGFIPVEESTGKALTDTLLSTLEEMKIPLSNMRGQGYDNGSNMKGKHAGVQARILSLNPLAFFVNCGTHSMNLSVNDAALSCTEAVNFFNLVQEIYNYFSASIHRWSVLKNHVTSLTVKPLSTTRWESRIDAVIPLRYHIGEIYDALYDLSEDPKSDAYSKNTALSLARKLKDFKFLCSLIVWHTILFRVNVVSKLMQKVDIHFLTSMELITKIISFFKEMRTDEGFESIIVDAKELAEILEIEPEFPPELQVRRRRVRRQFDYEAQDEPIVVPKDTFKINFYFQVLDRAINSLTERFSQLSNYNDIFGFMFDLNTEDKETLLNNCLNLQSALTNGDQSDINGSQLYQELLVLFSVSDSLPQLSKRPMEMLKFITTKNLSENFRNAYIAYRIAATLPVTVASAERSFSKLKLIKNYLRSTMSQDRLVGLAMMSIESEILENIDVESIIRSFAELKARKVPLPINKVKPLSPVVLPVAGPSNPQVSPPQAQVIDLEREEELARRRIELLQQHIDDSSNDSYETTAYDSDVMILD